MKREITRITKITRKAKNARAKRTSDAIFKKYEHMDKGTPWREK